MTSRINNRGGRNGWDQGNEVMNVVYEASKDLKLADIFAKFAKKADEVAQASL